MRLQPRLYQFELDTSAVRLSLNVDLSHAHVLCEQMQ